MIFSLSLATFQSMYHDAIISIGFGIGMCGEANDCPCFSMPGEDRCWAGCRTLSSRPASITAAESIDKQLISESFAPPSPSSDKEDDKDGNYQPDEGKADGTSTTGGYPCPCCGKNVQTDSFNDKVNHLVSCVKKQDILKSVEESYYYNLRGVTNDHSPLFNTPVRGKGPIVFFKTKISSLGSKPPK